MMVTVFAAGLLIDFTAGLSKGCSTCVFLFINNVNVVCERK